jgi:hypothetical protein
VAGRRGLSRALAAAVALAVSAACTHGGGSNASPTTTISRAPALTDAAPPLIAAGARHHTTGGSARVGVWGEPDPSAPTLAGAGVRALVLPQLFVAGPDGRWRSALVDPGSDRIAPDLRSATLKLRPRAVWSNRAPITADDLRRSADARFVAGIDGPTPDGTITVRFTQPLPGWRRLWSGTSSISPPAAGVWGGPFVVAGRTPGLETVLRRNDSWWGGVGPFLDEVHLVLVPDSTTARQLLAAAQLDVVMPPAGTVRTEQLRQVPGAAMDTANATGWHVSLFLNAARLDGPARAGVVAAVDRGAFVGGLLRDEATVADGFAGPEDGAWRGVAAGDSAGLKGKTVQLTGEIEEPMTQVLERSMQRRASAAPATFELRNAEADRVEGWLAAGDYQAAVVMGFDEPTPCWTCRWGSVDADLAKKADEGDDPAIVALEAKLREGNLVLPLWRPRAVVAWRGGLEGVRVNGWALNGAWDAWEWYRA